MDSPFALAVVVFIAVLATGLALVLYAGEREQQRRKLEIIRRKLERLQHTREGEEVAPGED
jgi:hypothetical protein